MLALFLLEFGNLVPKLIKFDADVLLPVAFKGSRTGDYLLDDGFLIDFMQFANLLLDHLLNGEYYPGDSEQAVGIVDQDFSLGYLIRTKHVLVELDFEGRNTFL